MLENWLSPIQIKDWEQGLPFDRVQIGDHIVDTYDAIKDMHGKIVALIGLNNLESDEIRKSFYRLVRFSNVKILDLGNLKSTEVSVVSSVLKELRSKDIIPIFIGADHKVMHSVHQAQCSKQKDVHPVIVDEKIGYGAGMMRSYLNPWIEHKADDFSALTILGYQSHFSDAGQLQNIGLRTQALRLGQIKSELEGAEPYIRDGSSFYFMMNAFKFSEAPGQSRTNPSGLYAEEACQLCKYAGLSDRMKSFTIADYSCTENDLGQTTDMIAQMIWYFVSGVESRFEEYPLRMDGLVEYLVNLEQLDRSLNFYRSEKSGRWWVASDMPRDESTSPVLYSCSYDDYLSTIQDEIPDRLVQLFK